MSNPTAINPVAAKLARMGSCVEAQDWLDAAHINDFKNGWGVLDAPTWLCWISVRVLGVAGLAAPLSVVRHTAPLADHPMAATLLALCEERIQGKANDNQRLLRAAYDTTQAALGGQSKNPQALIAIAYAAHAVAQSFEATLAPDASIQRKKRIRAANLAADAAAHAWDGAKAEGAAMVRAVHGVISDDVIQKAWDAAADGSAI